MRPDDTVTVLYTSGTTGNPKGVRLTHRNVLYEMAAATLAAGGTVGPGCLVSPPPAADGGQAEPSRWVSYLPLAHIAERMFSIYLATAGGGQVYFCLTGPGSPPPPRSSAPPGSSGCRGSGRRSRP